MLTAEEKAKELEFDLFVELRELVAGAAARLQATACALAEIDVLASLAELARSRGYVRPKVVAEPVLDIEAGRHPVLDVTEPEGTFVPNGVQRAAWSETGAATKLASSSPLDPPHHRPQHGRQEHVHPADGAADADGPDGQLRAGEARDDRRRRSDLRPRRGERRALARAKHVHGRDDRDGADSQHGHRDGAW